MRHEPCSFESYAKGPMKLVARNAFLARNHKEHGLQPKPHWDMAILENGSDLDGEFLAALVALIGADPGSFAAHFRDAINAAAMRANWTFRPNARFNPSVSGGFVLQDFGFEDGRF
jgi:hypothetical protein